MLPVVSNSLNGPHSRYLLESAENTECLLRFSFRPKRRRLVITEWIWDSLDEGTLLDEEGELH